MPTAKITKRNTEALRKGAIAELQKATSGEVGRTRLKEIIYWDDQLKGLGLRVGASGKASWLVYKRLGNGGGGAKQIVSVFGTLGETPDPDKARDKARALLEGIRNGTNPNTKKREKRSADIEAFKNGQTKDLLELWQARQPKAGYYGEEVARMIKVDILPTLGASTLVRDVSRKDVRNLIEGKQSIAVQRSLFAILRPFFKWCVEREVMPVSPCEGITPPKPCASRDRVLTDHEIVLFWRAACSLKYPWGPFYKLLLLTAQRRDEVAALPWSELDLSRRMEWIIPSARTKNGKEHLVHISPWCADILRSLDKSGDTLRSSKRDTSTFVFTTKFNLGAEGERIELPISGFSKAKRLLDKTMRELNEGKDIPDWRVHDLRRTAATGMGSLGVPPHIVERILNHVSGVNAGIVGVYQRFEYVEERRKALIDWSNHINGLLLEAMRLEREGSKNVLLFKA